MSQLAQRVLSAIPLLIGLLLLLFVAPLRVAIGVSAAIFIMAAWEWSALAALHKPVARVSYAAVTALLLWVAGWLVLNVGGLHIALWIALAWWVVALLWILRFPTPMPRLLVGLAGFLVLVPCWLAMMGVLRIPGQGPSLLLLALCMVFAADIGAYFVGRRFGRVKLAPQVSPGKTWEGLIGGVGLAALVGAVGGSLLGMPAAFMVPVGLGLAGLSVVGDLTESMFKRSVGAKDSGHLIPGHGGVLDRLDSITAALPFFALAMSWFGWHA